MKNSLISNRLFAALLAFSPVFTLQAQDKGLVAGTATDTQFANTTIIYKNQANATDIDVLNQLSDNFGIGEVVRIEMAPEKPQAQATLPAKPAAVVNKPAAKSATVASAQPKADSPRISTKTKPVDGSSRVVKGSTTNVAKATRPSKPAKLENGTAQQTKAAPVAKPAPVYKPAKTYPVKPTGKLYKHKKKGAFKGLNLFKKKGKRGGGCYKF